MPGKFICEKISVELDTENQVPVSFIWRKEKYLITSIKSSWQDYGFGSSPAPKRVPWRMRHHRTYYHVEIENRKVFELYLDRAGEEKTWILEQEI